MAERIADSYDLTTLIGRGPHASVWRARQVDSGDEVALKVLNARFARDPKVLERLEQERRVFAPVVHPAFVRLRELIIDVEVALVTELVSGEDLRGPDTFALDETVDIVGLVAGALAAAHAEDVVHGDIKPSNLLVTRLTGDLRITDGGLAHVLRGHRVGPTRFADPRYAAPEVILGGQPSPSSDIYQLGLVLYEMLTATAFIDGDEPMNVLSQHLAGAPIELPARARPLQAVVAACLSTDPKQRPTTAEVAEEFRRARRSRTTGPARNGEADAGAAFAMSPHVAPAAGAPAARPTASAGPTSPGLRTALGPPTSHGLASSHGFASSRGYATSQALAMADDDDHVPSRFDLVFPAAAAIDVDAETEANFPVSVGESGAAAYRYSQPGPRRSRRGLVAVALAVLLIGVVASLAANGIGGPSSGRDNGAAAGTPGADLTPTPVPTEVPATTPPTPPTPPPTAPTAEGASAFVRYWFDTVNFATTTGDLGPLEVASGSGCQACSAVEDDVRAAYQDGGTLRGGQYAVREVLADSFFSPNRPVVSVVFDRSPRSAIGPDGQLRNAVAGATFASCQVVLELAADQWTVRDVLCDTPLNG
jgi:hypothetical protein